MQEVCANLLDGCKARLFSNISDAKKKTFFQNLGLDARLLCKKLYCKATPLFKHFGFQTTLLFNQFGAEQDICSNI